MGAKKKLIVRIARWTAGVLALAAVVALVSLLVDLRDRRHHEAETTRRASERVEEARAYLAEIAKRIDALPVDATLAAEIESRYFEQRPTGAVYVWAMDTAGNFVFGVPRSAFDKLNAIYDREVTPRLNDGVFLDRQSFLLGLIDQSDDLGTRPASAHDSDLFARGERWRPHDRERSFVVSAPLKTTAGAALGSLYLKRTPPPQDHYRHDPRVEVAFESAGVAALLSFVFLWVLLPTWVYVDARDRGVRRAPLYAFLTVLSSLVGLLVYLIARPEEPHRLACPGCGREVNGGAFCPHCGRDLSRSICPACRYPLQADWAYCPACRTEVKAAAAAGAPVPEAG
jgi:hypothetical protein